MKNKKEKIQYPAQIKVDEELDKKTGRMKPIIIGTGPYSKAKCGETQKEINEYLAHIVEKYEQDKKFKEEKE